MTISKGIEIKDISLDQDKRDQKSQLPNSAYRTIFNKCPDFIYITDANGIILDVNQQLLDITGYSLKELIGLNALSFFIGENSTGINRSVEDVKLGREMRHIFMCSRNAKGEVRDYEVVAIPLKENDKVVKVLNFAHDITSFNRARAKLEESEKKYQKAYNLTALYKDILAHDMNNVLQNIISATELLEMNKDKPSFQILSEEWFAIIEEQSMRGAKLIRNIEKVSEIECEKVDLKPIDLISVLDEAIARVQQIHKGKDIHITKNLPFKSINVCANELLLDVVENILDNAIRYNDKANRTIEINASKMVQLNSSFFRLEFADNGTGIPDERKMGIFEQSYIKDKSTKGMGFGLSLVKIIIDHYGGQILVKDRIPNVPNQGALFILLIPEYVMH